MKRPFFRLLELFFLGALSGVLGPGALFVRGLAVAEAASPEWLSAVFSGVCSVGAAGLTADWLYRDKPEKFRLSPFSFGAFCFIVFEVFNWRGAAMASGMLVTAFSCVGAARFRPCDALGDFLPVSLRDARRIGLEACAAGCLGLAGYGLLFHSGFFGVFCNLAAALGVFAYSRRFRALQSEGA